MWGAAHREGAVSGTLGHFSDDPRRLRRRKGDKKALEVDEAGVEVLRRRGFAEEGKVRGGALGGSLRLVRGNRGGGGLARCHMEEGKGGPVHVAWRKTGPDSRPTAT
jgi:hypothetical protein